MKVPTLDHWNNLAQAERKAIAQSIEEQTDGQLKWLDRPLTVSVSARSGLTQPAP